MNGHLTFPDMPIRAADLYPTDPRYNELDDSWDGDTDGEGRCQTCCGDGYEDCEDTNSAEGCWEADCNGRIHTCPNCRGSGDAKDVWYW